MQRLYVLADLSLAILKELTSKKLWNSGAYPGEVILPTAYYKLSESDAGTSENEVVKTKVTRTFLVVNRYCGPIVRLFPICLSRRSVVDKRRLCKGPSCSSRLHCLGSP